MSGVRIRATHHAMVLVRMTLLVAAIVPLAAGFGATGCCSARHCPTLLHSQAPPIEATTNVGPTNGAESDHESTPTTNTADNAFEDIAGHASHCVLQSELSKDAVGEQVGKAAKHTTRWIDDASAFVLQKAMDKICLKLAADRSGVDRDEASTWIRWIKSTPTPLIIDLSSDLWQASREMISDKQLEQIDCSRDEFESRIGCRLILLPSGATMTEPLTEPPASIVYGKLLYGGVTRYRVLTSSNSNRPPRRAGERTEVKASMEDNIPAWLMYGGPDRNYEAMDMGAAAVLEMVLMRRGTTVPEIPTSADMTLNRIAWQPQKMFSFVQEDNGNANGGSDDDSALLGSVAAALSGKSRNEAFKADFQSSVGGLQPQIDSIVRRVLDGRVIRPAHVVDNAAAAEGEDETTAALASASADAEELALLGLTPVRGLLLYGPPGCGKTALAREISRALQARAPKIVSAPELLDRWVGGSERLVRQLFVDAEAELAACNGDATKSALHVVVIDEIDAVFRKRSGGEDSGEATRASAVNQILAKLDGVNAIPNVLTIGMTNRRELLDEALLRPGRLEVQVEIPLPDKEGRREILRIHFKALRERGRLSMPLCCALEGVASVNSLDEKGAALPSDEESSGFRQAVKRLIPDAVKPTYDLAVATAGFSGADISGLVRCAGSLALSRARKDGNGVEGLLITLEDVKEALKEVKK